MMEDAILPLRIRVSIVACMARRVSVDGGVTFSWGGLEALLHPNNRCFGSHYRSRYYRT
jgi:hypothetical protein